MPRIRPAPPVPANARPTMNRSEEFERAQIREPISKSARAMRKTFCDFLRLRSRIMGWGSCFRAIVLVYLPVEGLERGSGRC